MVPRQHIELKMRQHRATHPHPLTGNRARAYECSSKQELSSLIPSHPAENIPSSTGLKHMANAELWQQRGVWEKRHDKPYIHKQLWSHAGVGQSKSCTLRLLDSPIPWCQYSPPTQHCPIRKSPSKRRGGIFLQWPCWVLTCSCT